MHILLVVEEVGEAHHHQKGAAKGRNRQMRIGHDAGIFIRLGGGKLQRLPRADLCGNGNDGQRKDNTHAEHGNDNAPGQEAVLPLGRHILQLVGIDDGIVEGQRDFQNRQHKADEEHRRHAGDRAGRLPAEPGTERKANGGKGKRPGEIAEA